MSTGAPVYKVEDRSILLPFYRRFFVDPLLPYLPAKLHPNAITHAGHLVNLSGAVLLIVAWPKRGWLLVVAMVLLQLYTWCDNADGAHARRTNQCSALGEFLDHGLDGLNTVYIGYTTAMAFGVRPMWWVILALLIPGAAAVTYWEQTQTGVFRLGMLNQLESVTVLSLTLVVSALFGTPIWERLSLFGFTAQRAMLFWVTATILFGMVRGIQRVGARHGLGAILPIVALIALGIAIAAAAATSAISTVTAVTLATCANVYFSTRMLSFRLHDRAPRVELAVLVFTAGLLGLIAWRLLGQEVASLVGPALSVLAVAVFGGQTVLDARAGIQRLEQLPAR